MLSKDVEGNPVLSASVIRWMHQTAPPRDIPRYVLQYRVFIPARCVILEIWKQLKCTVLDKLCHVYISQWMNESYMDQHE